jgi:hypothetical protein
MPGKRWSLDTATGREQFQSAFPGVELRTSPTQSTSRITVTTSGTVEGGRDGVRRLSTFDAARTATAAIIRAWSGSVRAERLGLALSVLRWDAGAAWREVEFYGVPYADRGQPVTYYRMARERLTGHAVNRDDRALVEAEAAANELLFVACANVFASMTSQDDSIFDATFGVQVARALTTKTACPATEEFLFRLAELSGAGRHWRLAERAAGGQEPLGVAQIRETLARCIAEYGGPDQAFVDESHLGEIALRAYLDRVPTSAGSRGARIPGNVFLWAGFIWSLDATGRLNLTKTERELLWNAFLAGVTYSDTQYYVATLRSPLESGGESGTKACPDCAEDVKAAARKCRFCGYEFQFAA